MVWSSVRLSWWCMINCWFKVVKMNCQNLTTQDCMSWPFWGGTKVIVLSINQKDLYRGMVKCQTIMVVYVCLVCLRDEELNALKR